jgi:hypothetical protein
MVMPSDPKSEPPGQLRAVWFRSTSLVLADRDSMIDAYRRVEDTTQI